MFGESMSGSTLGYAMAKISESTKKTLTIVESISRRLDRLEKSGGKHEENDAQIAQIARLQEANQRLAPQVKEHQVLLGQQHDKIKEQQAQIDRAQSKVAALREQLKAVKDVSKDTIRLKTRSQIALHLRMEMHREKLAQALSKAEVAAQIICSKTGASPAVVEQWIVEVSNKGQVQQIVDTFTKQDRWLSSDFLLADGQRKALELDETDWTEGDLRNWLRLLKE